MDEDLNRLAGLSRRQPDASGTAAGPDPDGGHTLARAQLLRDDPATALASARHLADLLPGRPDPLDLLVDVALEHGLVQRARAVLALAEADAAAHPSAPLPATQIAILKARLALSEADFPAAKAILVTAIEAAPEVAALRTLLAEVMVAAGTAADARAVLTHLGQPPVNPPASAKTETPDPRQRPEHRTG